MTDTSKLRRFDGTLTAALLVAVLAGCSSSGRIPDTGGVEPEQYLARFSGSWGLDRDASDDPARVFEAHGREGAHNRGRGGSVGGHGAGRHGGGGRPGGGSHDLGRPDPAAMEATFVLLRAVPDRFVLTVSDSLVVTTCTGGGEALIPVAGDAVPTTERGRRIETRAKWDGGSLRIERRVEGGGTIIDLVTALAEGNRLLVIRTAKGMPRDMPEVRLAFEREEVSERARRP